MASEMPVFAWFPIFCLKGVAPPLPALRRPPLSRPATRSGRGRAAVPAVRYRPAPSRAPPRRPATPRLLCPAPAERGGAGQGKARAGATRPSSQSRWSCWLLASAWPLAQGRQAVAAPWRSRLTGVVFSGRY